MALSGRYWAYHPKPLPDELFSSWLLRIAAGNAPATKLRSFCRTYWPDRSIWFRDIDRCVDEALLQDVAWKTGTDYTRAKQTSLRAYEGYVFEKIKTGGHSRWICPLGIYHSTRKLYGMRWCPKCLSTDVQPYFRKFWRMSFTSSCPKHGVLLADRCHYCASPCIPHKNGFLTCHKCNTDLRQHPCLSGFSETLQSDYNMTRMANDGIYGLSETGFLHSILFFDTWYRVMSILVYGERSAALRSIIYETYGGDPTHYNQSMSQNRSIDTLNPHDLHKMKGLAVRLMTNFPRRFIRLCVESENWSTQIIKNMKPRRYRLSSVAKTYLYNPYSKTNLPLIV